MKNNLSFLNGLNILITGGTGSFGKKFIEIVLKEALPGRVVVFSRDELKQHEMKIGAFNDPRIRYFIGDVRDQKRLQRAFRGIDIVVHAAALKQVPACEYNPIEAIETNINGTRNVVDAAIDCGVSKAILVSTDKATSPVNLYGATKLVAEKLFIHGNSYTGGKKPILSCVRYGNVVGSRGSVVPIFLAQRQIDGNKLTVTDERMTRFWITLDQGARFVLNALSLMNGGEVFVPKIPSVKVSDLAQAIAPDKEIKVIGIRHGEKLHECLLSLDEARYAGELDDMYVLYPPFSPYGKGEVTGKPLTEGFHYSSDTNDWQLNQQELLALLQSSEIEGYDK